MSIKIHHGAPGSYKTSGAVEDDFIPCISQGRVVITNVRGLTRERVLEAKLPLTFYQKYFQRIPAPFVLSFPDVPDTFDVIAFDTTLLLDREKLGRFFHWAPKGAFFLIDEAQSIFPDRWMSRDILALDYPGGVDAAAAAGRPATWADAWDMHRHYGWDITLTTPNIKKIRTDIREAAEGAFKHRNLGMLGIKGRYNEGFHDAQENGLPSHFLSVTPKKISAKVWSLYDSTTTGTFSDTLAGFKIWKDPKILFLVGVLALSLLFSLTHLPAFITGPKVPSSVPPAVVQPSALPLSKNNTAGVSNPLFQIPASGVSLSGAENINPRRYIANGNVDNRASVGVDLSVNSRVGESPWNAVGHYVVGKKHYIVMQREGVLRTLVDVKGAVYEGSRIEFDFEGLRVSTYSGIARSGPFSAARGGK